MREEFREMIYTVRFRKTVVYRGAIEVTETSRGAALAAARKAFAAEDERHKWSDSDESAERAFRVEADGNVVLP